MLATRKGVDVGVQRHVDRVRSRLSPTPFVYLCERRWTILHVEGTTTTCTLTFTVSLYALCPVHNSAFL
jgi:hypothetical protein